MASYRLRQSQAPTNPSIDVLPAHPACFVGKPSVTSLMPGVKLEHVEALRRTMCVADAEPSSIGLASAGHSLAATPVFRVGAGRAATVNGTPPRALGMALAALPLLVGVGCGGGGQGGTDGSLQPEAQENWQRKLQRTDLVLDLEAQTGRAVITVSDGAAPGASLAIGELTIHDVRGRNGPLAYRVREGQLDIGVPDTGAPVAITVDYAFAAQDLFEGWNPESGLSFLWPDFCGNLFPCRPATAEGQTYRLSVQGVPAGSAAIYPEAIASPSPAYMPAIAVGPFTELALGATQDGTRLKVWYRPGEATAATAGTAHLLGAMDFYEQTYGPYPYGEVAGSVSAAWGSGSFGGMEHHPFWHVAEAAMDDPEVHAHEAAHGWFGNGVRMACWEDFVLSEGTVSYMAARALGEQGVDLWPDYACRLQRICRDEQRNTIALPPGCNEIDLDQHPLWSQVPYMKGAYFFRAVAERVGVEPLDRALARFHEAHVGGAVRMDTLIDALRQHFPSEAFEIGALANGWLRQRACPEIPAGDCPTSRSLRSKLLHRLP